MSKVFIAGLLIAMFSFFFCVRKKDKITFDSGAMLSFSSSHIFFDTIFSSTASVTKRLKVYNKNRHAISIASIYLANQANSPFKIIVGGQSATYLSDIFLAGGDSLLILVSVFINPSERELPYLVEDSIIFITNGNTQSVLLQAYGQDAHFKVNSTISCNEIWKRGKPYLIIGFLTIPATCTLTIEKGVRVYFRKNASLQVYGTLNAVGSKDSLIVFAGDKLSETYQNLPGQWTGIVFHTNSTNNRIEFSKILNAETAITVQPTTDSDTVPELTVANTYIFNMTKSALRCESTDVYVYNSIFGNTVSYLVTCNGGNYYFYHNTFANFEYSYFREAALVFFSNTSSALKSVSMNTIFWGNKTDEIHFNNVNPSHWILEFYNCLIKTSSSIWGASNLLNTDPLFESEIKMNYRPKINSPAINSGIVIPNINKDIEDNPRDSMPDIGAFEK